MYDSSYGLGYEVENFISTTFMGLVRGAVMTVRKRKWLFFNVELVLICTYPSRFISFAVLAQHIAVDSFNSD